MSDFEFRLTPAIRSPNDEGSLDTSVDSNGNSLQRTGYIDVYNSLGYRKIVQLSDGVQFDDVVEPLYVSQGTGEEVPFFTFDDEFDTEVFLEYIELDVGATISFENSIAYVSDPDAILSIDFENDPTLTGALDISQCGNIQYLYASGTGVREIYIDGGAPLLEELECDNTPIVSLDLTDCIGLVYVRSDSCLLLEEITFVNCTNFISLEIDDCPLIEEIIMTPNVSFTGLDATNCESLASVIVNGITGENGKTYFGLSDCNLSDVALDTFFTALGTFAGGKSWIDVANNPGSLTCDPTIATNKGWSVYGTEEPGP